MFYPILLCWMSPNMNYLLVVMVLVVEGHDGALIVREQTVLLTGVGSFNANRHGLHLLSLHIYWVTLYYLVFSFLHLLHIILVLDLLLLMA